MKTHIKRIEDLERDFRSKSNLFLKKLYCVFHGKYIDFADMDMLDRLEFASIDDLRKHYTDQNFQIVDIFVFKIPGRVVVPSFGTKCTPKERPNAKRVLICVMEGQEIEQGHSFENTEEIARIKEKYDNI